MLFKIEFLKFFCLFALYFVQAFPFGLQSRYLPLVYRKSGVSITSLGLYKLLLIPWVCKFFLSAFIIDVYNTKRFWLLTAMLSLSVGSFIGSLFDGFFELAFILFFLNWASAIQDVCVDYVAINLLKKEDLGIGNTIQVGAFKLGTLFTGGLLVSFMDFTSISTTFTILGTIYLLIFIFLKFDQNLKNETNFVEIKDKDEVSITFKERLLLLHNSPGTYWICIFVFIYKLGEQSSLNMIPIYLIDHKVSSSTIGLWTGVIGQSFSIAGSILSGIILKKTHQKISTELWIKYIIVLRIIPISLMTFLIVTIENLGQKEINDQTLNLLLYLVLAQLFASGILTTFTFTLMMEVTFLSEKKIQATHFSLLATFEVLGKLLFQPIASAYTDYYGYSSAFILFTFLYCSCLFFLKFQSKYLKIK